MSYADVILLPINKISQNLISTFSSGNLGIDGFFKNDAADYDGQNICKTFLLVASSSDEIIGFFSLSADTTKLTKNFRKDNNVDAHNLEFYPAVNISYFAIDKKLQQQGFGVSMMQIVFELVAQRIAPLLGVVMLTVESLATAKTFYEQTGFQLHSSHNSKGNVSLGVPVSTLSNTI